MTKIVALCGKKQSGKTTLCNYLHGHEMKRHDIIEKFFISPEGHLVVNSVYYDENGKEFEEMGVLDLFQFTPEFTNFAGHRIWPLIKGYSFADALKEICINLFGLSYEQCYGSDADKETLTKLKWEDMPGVISASDFDQFIKTVRTPLLGDTSELRYPLLLDPAGPDSDGWWNSTLKEYGILVRSTDKMGYMTARQVMQFFGTDIMRRMYSNIWIQNCLTRIQSDQSPIAVICDCRYVNEIEEIKKIGGKVIRLTRSPFESTHQSEIDADNYTDYDAVIDNQNMTTEESQQEFLKIMIDMGITQKIRFVGNKTASIK